MKLLHLTVISILLIGVTSLKLNRVENKMISTLDEHLLSNSINSRIKNTNKVPSQISYANEATVELYNIPTKLRTNPIYLTRIGINNGEDQEGTDFYFTQGASTGLDPGYDGMVPFNPPSFSIYSYLVDEDQGIPMMVQALGEDDCEDVTISVGVNAPAGEQVIFSITDYNMPEGIDVFIDDTLTNISTLLNFNDYTITPDEDLNGPGRFFIRFKNADFNLSLQETEFYQIKVYYNSIQETIDVSGSFNYDTTLGLYNLQGQLVKSLKISPQSNGLTIQTDHLESGVYLVQLSNGFQKKTSKLILN